MYFKLENPKDVEKDIRPTHPPSCCFVKLCEFSKKKMTKCGRGIQHGNAPLPGPTLSNS